MAHEELKALQVRRAKLEAEIRGMRGDIEMIETGIADRKAQIQSIDGQIKTMTEREPVVSEHALLRYIERVLNVDLEAIKGRILTEQNRKAIAFAGNCRIKSEGVEFVVKDRTVVSVIA